MPNNPIVSFYKLIFAQRRLDWKREKLIAYGEKKLRDMIHYAYEWSPYYQKLFKSLSLTPSDIKTFKDLPKIPIITKEQLRNNIDQIYSKEFLRNQCQLSITGGSTGIPMEIRYDWSSSNYSRIINLRSNIIWGLKPRTRFCITSAGYAIPEGGRFSRYYPIFNPYYMSVYDPVSEGIQLLLKKKIEFIGGYSSHIGLLAQHALDIGEDRIRLVGGCGSSDQMQSKIKENFEKAFGGKLGDLIGSVELNRTAWECPECGKYHLDIDSVYTEFVDANNDLCGENEEGNIVYTTLFNHATPLIRFNIEDVGKLGERDQICKKYEFPIMDAFIGRLDDFFVGPDGTKVSPITWTVLGRRYLSLKQFQFIQTQRNTIVANLVYDGPDDKELENNLMKDIKNVTWPGVEVLCERVDSIERTKSGKLKCAINIVGS